MKKKYYWVIGCVLLFMLAAFFYPKQCGYWDVLQEKNCNCYGFMSGGSQPNIMAEGWDYTCYGVCVSDCVCKEGIVKENRTVINCD